MRMGKFKQMDAVEYKSFLYKFLDDYRVSLTEATTSDDHARAFHSNLTDERLLDRCRTEHRNSSQFICYKNNSEIVDMNYYVAETLYSRGPQIAEWMTDRRSGYLMEINADFGETIGYGFEKDTGLKKDTDWVRMFLRKSYDEGCQLGFYIETAYPDIEHETARYVGQLSRDPYENGKLSGNSFDGIEEIMSKEAFLASLTGHTQGHENKEETVKNKPVNPEDINLNVPDDYFFSEQAQQDLIHNFASAYGFNEEDIYVSPLDQNFLLYLKDDTPLAMISGNSLFVCNENIANVKGEDITGMDYIEEIRE